MRVRSLGWEDPLEEGLEINASILAQRIPWAEEPGSLQSQGHKESETIEATQQNREKEDPIRGKGSMKYKLFV